MELSEAEKQEIIAEAQLHYQNGDPLRAGMLIYERIPLEKREKWAGSILELLYSQIEPTPELDASLKFVQEPHLWPVERRREAHFIFDAIPHQSWNEPPRPDTLYDLICSLARDVVGVTYTTRQFPAQFDHYRGWSIVEWAKKIVEFVNDADLSDSVWQAIFDDRYIALTSAISCHPGCPTCRSPRWIYFD